MDYINAFWVGGLICALAQILLDRTKMMPGRVMVSLVVLGCILGFVQIFKPLQEYAGAGVSVPLLGFGNTLWNGVKEAVDKEGFIGIFLGGFKASAAGISGALIFGYIASWSFRRMFHIRRGTCPCCNDCGGRLWRSGACCNIESFWKCRKRIPFSTWLCESETTFFYLDSDRKRSLSGRKKEKPGADQWSDDWENCGLWAEGFAEHGSVYGTGSV